MILVHLRGANCMIIHSPITAHVESGLSAASPTSDGDGLLAMNIHGGGFSVSFDLVALSSPPSPSLLARGPARTSVPRRYTSTTGLLRAMMKQYSAMISFSAWRSTPSTAPTEKNFTISPATSLRIAVPGMDGSASASRSRLLQSQCPTARCGACGDHNN